MRFSCVLEHGHGSGAVQKAACGDVGIVRGETTLKAKAWVVRGWTRTAGRLLDWQWARFERTFIFVSWNTGTVSGCAGAACGDVGIVRGNTTHNAKDWVVGKST